MELVQITSNNLFYIHRFLKYKSQISQFFRYFNTRTPQTAILNHLYTLVCVNEDDEPVGYGHLDAENQMWLGICVYEAYKGCGIGNQIMLALLTFADTNHLPLHLTVDKENTIAKEMYERRGFSISKETETSFTMIRKVKGE